MAVTKITEKYSYLTDIITSYDGHEQRLALRQKPRHYVSYDYEAMEPYQAHWLRGIMRARATDVRYIPMWHKPAVFRLDFVSGSKNIYIPDVMMYSFYECDAVEVFRAPGNLNNLTINVHRKVQNYLTGVIGLKDEIDTDLPKETTLVYPMMRCVTQPTEALRYLFSNGSEVALNFEDICFPVTMSIPSANIVAYDTSRWLNPWHLPTYINGKEVLTWAPPWDGDDNVQLSVSKCLTEMDNSTGQWLYDLRNDKSYDIHSITFNLMDRAMINNMIRFFRRVKGRFKSFYVPTWVNDVDVYGDINAGANFVLTKFSELYGYYLNNKRRKKLVIFASRYRTYIVDIIAYTYETLNNVRYTKIIFSNSVPVALRRSEIIMCSYMELVRLDSDDLQLDYETTNVARCTVSMREVDDI